ncbi:RNA polymerase sigma factor [Paenibacillus herberti]|uniref:RNA polymerase subunit sigma-24 n=1 Tax=Paenibacillus herberti TaxID=1619309 RepID=A0A229NU79_9BACL|nr:sigma factor [Paenibacillus herberti]OXM13364.1 RNA polymerase subunit sigma-24 [Paenibacillus herberti]
MSLMRYVKKAKKGDKEALLHLILLEKESYYKLAFSYMGNANDAMDAMEDMIVRVYEKIDQLRDPEVFYSWSKTILANGCKSMLHKRNKLVLVDEWQPDQESEPSCSGKAETNWIALENRRSCADCISRVGQSI